LRVASQQVAVIFASLLGVLVNSLIPTEQMAAWGWRIPVLIGCLSIPLILILRRSLKETEEFASRKRIRQLARCCASSARTDRWFCPASGSPR
jgi:MFS family permease